jgi:hypothetical protein
MTNDQITMIKQEDNIQITMINEQTVIINKNESLPFLVIVIWYLIIASPIMSVTYNVLRIFAEIGRHLLRSTKIVKTAKKDYLFVDIHQS